MLFQFHFRTLFTSSVPTPLLQAMLDVVGELRNLCGLEEMPASKSPVNRKSGRGFGQRPNSPVNRGAWIVCHLENCVRLEESLEPYFNFWFRIFGDFLEKKLV